MAPFEQGPLGGALREYPLFAQDGDKRREPKDCSKNQYAQGALSPGVLVRAVSPWACSCTCSCAPLSGRTAARRLVSGAMQVCLQVFWCNQCGRAVAWSLLADSESPGTVHELMYVFFGDAPKRLAYDNGCNLMSYMLNRDPAQVQSVEVYIDALHAKNHVACARSFSTGASQRAAW